MNTGIKKILSENEMNSLINEVVDSICNKINEADMSSNQLSTFNSTPVKSNKPTTTFKPNTISAPKTIQPIKKDISNVKPSNINQSNVKSPDVTSASNQNGSNITKKKPMNKIQYQIFNIKLRTNKLELNDAVRRFIQSMHDFDINVTKNSTDLNEIQSYLFPTQGNLIALKGALESLESEFNELQKLLETENGDQ